MFNESIDITEARAQLTRLPERLREDRVIRVTRRNRPVLALVDPDYLDAVLETIEIMSDPASYAVLMESLEDIRAGRVHSQLDVRRKLLGE